VLTWKTRIAQLKWVEVDNTVGYGRTFKTNRRTRLAILPVGYSDGYDRGLSNQAHVLIRERRAPVVGRICMNMMMVDVTDIPDVALEEEVVLLGRQGKERITAEQLAELCGTINYEMVSRINSEIARIIIP
jgi:alanine racemase